MEYNVCPNAEMIGSAGNIIIEGRTQLTASGLLSGIGGGKGKITIRSGKVEAKGIENTGGCGFYLMYPEGGINIQGGDVTAIGFDVHPAISLEKGTITLSGGTISAQAKGYAIGSRMKLSAGVEGKLTLEGNATLSAISTDYVAFDKNATVNKHLFFNKGCTLETWSPQKETTPKKSNTPWDLNFLTGKYEDKELFYDEAQFLVGNTKDRQKATLLPAQQRQGAYKNKLFTYMLIQPCDHVGATYTITPENHRFTCAYCTTFFKKYDHEMVNDVCQVCGYHSSNLVSVGFDKGSEEAGGEMASVGVSKDSEYALPECSFTPPLGMYFEAWKDGNTLRHPGDKIRVSKDMAVTALWGHSHQGTDFIPWIDSTSLPGTSQAGGSYTLTSDVVLTKGWTWTTGTLNLCLAGHTISGASTDGPLLTVEGGTVNLFVDANGGTLTQSGGQGATVFVGKDGSFTMHGGTISGAERFWAGVDVYGRFTMTGGSVTGNAIGVACHEGAVFTVSGGACVADNAKEDVYLEDEKEMIQIGGALEEGARIGVTAYDHEGAVTSGLLGRAGLGTFFSRDGWTMIHIHGDGEAYREEVTEITLLSGLESEDEMVISSAGPGNLAKGKEEGKFFYDASAGKDLFCLPSNPFPYLKGLQFVQWRDEDSEETYPGGALVEAEDLTLTAEWEMIPVFRSHSLILGGLIGINFFLELPFAPGLSYDGSYMEFSVAGLGGATTKVDFDPESSNRSGDTYGFTCTVSSIQMADEITATFHYGEGKMISETYSVAKYIEEFNALPDQFDEAAVKVVHAIADLGHFMQPVLAEANGWELGRDHAEMPGYNKNLATKRKMEDLTKEIAQYPFKWDVYGSRVDDVTFDLSLNSATTLRIFLTPEEGYNGELTAYLGEGTENVALPQADGRYLITIPDIPAHLLGQTYTIHGLCDGEYWITLSPLTYVSLALSGDTYKDDAQMQNALNSLYQYYKAVMAYRNS